MSSAASDPLRLSAEGSVPLNPQHLLITLFGLYGRPAGAALPVAVLIRLLGDLGIGAPAVRSTISRLKKRGLLDAVKSDGLSAYAMTPSMEETFREGDERIFGTRRAAAEDRWILAVFTVPEAQRNLRHRIRAGLTHLGFGAVAPGIWIAPEHLQDAARSSMARQGLSSYFDWFTGDYLGSREGADAIGQWWDLEGLARLYTEFIERHQHLDDVSPEDQRGSFAAHLPMITQWRRLPYLDPGLPLELLPAQWPGLTAQHLFADLHERLAGAAADHVQRRLAGG